jgi:hypothetical protein
MPGAGPRLADFNRGKLGHLEDRRIHGRDRGTLGVAGVGSKEREEIAP